VVRQEQVGGGEPAEEVRAEQQHGRARVVPEVGRQAQLRGDHGEDLRRWWSSPGRTDLDFGMLREDLAAALRVGLLCVAR
jgi:hypothetical protein